MAKIFKLRGSNSKIYGSNGGLTIICSSRVGAFSIGGLFREGGFFEGGQFEDLRYTPIGLNNLSIAARFS